MTFDQFQKLSESFTAIPVYRRLLADTVTPVSLFLKIREEAAYPFLLESVEGGEHLARYSFLGRNPFRLLRYEDGQTVVIEPEHLGFGPSRRMDHSETDETATVPEAEAHSQAGARPGTVAGPVAEAKPDEGAYTRKTLLDGNYFDHLKSLTTRYREPKLKDLPSLTGGAVGYSAYDTVRLVEHLPDVPHDDLGLPEAIWCFYDEIYAFDHVKHQIVLIKTVFLDDDGPDLKAKYNDALRSLDVMQSVTEGYVKKKLPFSLSRNCVDSNTEKDHFLRMVEKAKSYIYEGDIFQVVLSQRFRTSYSGDRFMLYRALRMVNPSPYLFYLDFHDFALIGSSPEVLVRVQDGKAEVLPIAGTRPRGKSEEEDLYYENDLRNDPKEVAEHIMLVDLGRNDLSRICKSDTVKMVRNQVIERYSHVMHIVSDVTGQLADGATAVDALMNCFPAGTVSGAPKVRAMEIIDEMEPSKRGPYAGAVGYFDFSGNMDTCIAIRTMVATDHDIYIQAGAGIVADSVPDKEYDETVNKARALVEALGVALTLNSPEA